MDKQLILICVWNSLRAELWSLDISLDSLWLTVG